MDRARNDENGEKEKGTMTASGSFDVLLFDLRGLRCALDVTNVREVVPMPPQTPVALAPPVLRAVVPVRGHALPLLDIGPYLAPARDRRRDPAAPGPRRREDVAIVFEAHVASEPAPVRAALAVDRVLRVATFDETHARPAPSGPASFVTAVLPDAEGPALLVDAGRALDRVITALKEARV